MKHDFIMDFALAPTHMIIIIFFISSILSMFLFIHLIQCEQNEKKNQTDNVSITLFQFSKIFGHMFHCNLNDFTEILNVHFVN